MSVRSGAPLALILALFIVCLATGVSLSYAAVTGQLFSLFSFGKTLGVTAEYAILTEDGEFVWGRTPPQALSGVTVDTPSAQGDRIVLRPLLLSSEPLSGVLRYKVSVYLNDQILYSYSGERELRGEKTASLGLAVLTDQEILEKLVPGGRGIARFELTYVCLDGECKGPATIASFTITATDSGIAVERGEISPLGLG